MSILNCLLTKLQMQNTEFKGKPYDSLSDAEKKQVLSAPKGYVRPEHVSTVQGLISEKMKAGMDEMSAAKEVHDSLEQSLQTKSITLKNTADAVARTMGDIDRAVAKGIPLKNVASSIWNSSPGRDMRYGGVLQDTISWNHLVSGAKQRIAGYYAKLADAMPPSLFGVRNQANELKVAQALFGDTSDPKFANLADGLHKAVQAMNKDLQTLGMRTIDEDRLLTGVMARGDKIRNSFLSKGNESAYDTFMNREGMFDWSKLQRDNPGKLETKEQQAHFLNEIKRMALSEGAYKAEDWIDGSKLYFKTPEDWADFNSRFGQGGLLNVLSHVADTYSREFAQGKLTGGNMDAFRAGVLQHVGANYQAEATDFMKAFDSGMSMKRLTMGGQVDGLIRQAGDLLKDQVVMNHIGYSGIAGILHFPMAAVTGAQRGISSISAVGEGLGNMLRSVLAPGSFKEYASRLAQASVNSDRVLTVMGRSLDNHVGNPVTRAFKTASSSVYNLSTETGLHRMIGPDHKKKK